MRITHITFRLLFGLFVFCIPSAYGAAYLDFAHNIANYFASSITNYYRTYFKKTVPPEKVTLLNEYVCLDGRQMTRQTQLKAEYEEAMKVYGDAGHFSFGKPKSRAFYQLKNKMGKQKKWHFFLVAGYVRLYLNKRASQEVYVPKDLLCVIEKFVEAKNTYQAIEKTVLQWALADRKWIFITEWLQEGINDTDLCTDIGLLEAHANTIYLYGSNFLNKPLLQWLTNTKQWAGPTNAQIKTYNDRLKYDSAYKMQYIQLFLTNNGAFIPTLNHFLAKASYVNTNLSEVLVPELFDNGDTLFYYLACVHILNKYTVYSYNFSQSAKKRLHSVRDRLIAKKPYILAPFSYFSVQYWQGHTFFGKADNVNELVRNLLCAIGSLISAMVIKYPARLGLLVALFIIYIIFKAVISSRYRISYLVRHIEFIDNKEIPWRMDTVQSWLAYGYDKKVILHKIEEIAKILALQIAEIKELLTLDQSALKNGYQQKLLASQEALRALEKQKRALEKSLEIEKEKAKKIDDDNDHLPNTSHFWELLGSLLVLILCFFGVWGGTLLWTKRNDGHDL